MEKRVSDQTNLSHVARLQVVGIIRVAAIIEVAAIIKAAATVKVVCIGGMTIGLHTIPEGATPILDANRVILDEDPIPEVLLTLVHPGDVLTGPDLHPDPT